MIKFRFLGATITTAMGMMIIIAVREGHYSRLRWITLDIRKRAPCAVKRHRISRDNLSAYKLQTLGDIAHTAAYENGAKSFLVSMTDGRKKAGPGNADRADHVDFSATFKPGEFSRGLLVCVALLLQSSSLIACDTSMSKSSHYLERYRNSRKSGVF